MVGNVFVHYAAFSATRAAIVQIPQDAGPLEPRNTVTVQEDSRKLYAIGAAAAYALVPVSGPLEQPEGSADAFVRGLESVFSSSNTAGST